jgi:hypothetical protein
MDNGALLDRRSSARRMDHGCSHAAVALEAFVRAKEPVRA